MATVKATCKVDVLVEDHGNVFMVTPMTPAARAWVKKNVQLEGWQWMGASFAADQHYIENLMFGMQEAGLNVA